MLDFGFIILIIGSIMISLLRLSAWEERRALSPRHVLLRNSALESIKESRERGYYEACIFIAAGLLIILSAGVVD